MMDTIVAVAVVVTAIKEVGCLSSCIVLLDHVTSHLLFQSPKKLEAALMVDTIVLLVLIPLETMMSLHRVHCTITA
jgi:hypothetical protein